MTTQIHQIWPQFDTLSARPDNAISEDFTQSFDSKTPPKFSDVLQEYVQKNSLNAPFAIRRVNGAYSIVSGTPYKR